MLFKATLVTAIATFCAPAVGDELQSYKVTVVEQIRHEITVEAEEEYAARTDAVLEARRTSASGKPWWQPSPPAILTHGQQSDGFVVIDIKRIPPLAAPYPAKIRIGLLDRVATP
jgi:hypothetical protein